MDAIKDLVIAYQSYEETADVCGQDALAAMREAIAKINAYADLFAEVSTYGPMMLREERSFLSSALTSKHYDKYILRPQSRPADEMRLRVLESECRRRGVQV